jgi:hypothetical protein
MKRVCLDLVTRPEWQPRASARGLRCEPGRTCRRDCQAPVEGRDDQIGYQLAVRRRRDVTARDGSIEKRVDPLASRSLEWAYRVFQGRVAANLRVEIGDDAPDLPMAKHSSERE